MILASNIKNFLENHIELIDQNKWECLWLDAFDNFNYQDMITLVIFLEEADVYNKEEHENALMGITIMALDEWAPSDGGVTQMPLKDFIQAFLDNRLGFELQEAMDIIYKNRDEVIDYVDIFYEGDTLVINRHKSLFK